MEKVIIEPLDKWCFECPKCRARTELDAIPHYQDSVYCDWCLEEFEPDGVD